VKIEGTVTSGALVHWPGIRESIVSFESRLAKARCPS
jgi:hypothetical protein